MMEEVGASGICTPHPRARWLHSVSPTSWIGGVRVKSERGHRVSALSGFTSRLLHDSLLYSQVLPGCGVNPGLLLWCFQRGDLCCVRGKSHRDCVLTAVVQELMASSNEELFL